MTTVVELVIMILATASFCFIAFQMWYYIENYNYILQFNKLYSNLEYALSPSLNFIDSSYYDPNDSVLTTKDKWRCVLDKSSNYIYSISSFGFLSNNSTSTKK